MTLHMEVVDRKLFNLDKIHQWCRMHMQLVASMKGLRPTRPSIWPMDMHAQNCMLAPKQREPILDLGAAVVDRLSFVILTWWRRSYRLMLILKGPVISIRYNIVPYFTS